MAYVGPMPMTRGASPCNSSQRTWFAVSSNESGPETAVVTYFPMIGVASSIALRLVINSTAAAPSVT